MPTAVATCDWACKAAGAFLASCRVLKGRSALVTAPSAQAPKMRAKAWCWPSNARGCMAYRLTLPLTWPSLVTGRDRVEVIWAPHPNRSPSGQGQRLDGGSGSSADKMRF